MCIASFPILVKQISAYQNWCNSRVSAYAIHCVAIQNKRPAPTNAVFFPSAQMKNERYKPNKKILKRKRFQPEHKAPKHHVEVAMSDLHLNCTNYIGTNHRG